MMEIKINVSVAGKSQVYAGLLLWKIVIIFHCLASQRNMYLLNLATLPAFTYIQNV